MIRTILVALDGSSRAAGVFDAAVEIARPMRSRLVLYRALSIPPDFSPAGSRTTLDPLPELMEKEARVALLASSERVPDLPCELRIEIAIQPARGILAAAAAVDADLIVLGSHGYHGWDRLLGTTAGKVANLARRNVLVVHEPEDAAVAPRRGKHP